MLDSPEPRTRRFLVTRLHYEYDHPEKGYQRTDRHFSLGHAEDRETILRTLTWAAHNGVTVTFTPES